MVSKATFAIELPQASWIAELSRSFPDTEFLLLTGIATDDGAVELGEVVGGDLDAVVDAIGDHADVRAVDPVYADADRAVAQYRTSERSLYEFLRASSLPPEFPITVANGWFEMEVTAARDQIAEVRRTLESADWPHEVVSIVETTDPDGLVTDRQRDLLERALRMGYFEVPRECTLAEVAEAAGVDPSTASGVLRRGEARIVEWFLVGAGGSSGDG